MKQLRVAIYEPFPRICGPDSWAQHLKRGFCELSHHCDIVSFTNSGDRPPRWGRVERAKSSSMSCQMVPDVCESRWDAGDVLNGYDLVVLTDVKTPAHDKAATDAGDPWPEYVQILSETKTRWTSALHGRWYYSPDEVPEGLSAASGSPYINELLELENFSGFVIKHANDFDRYCEFLRRACVGPVMPLPYVLGSPDDLPYDRPARSLAVIGRIIPTKHRHVINECMTRGFLPGWTAIYGGACTCTHAPSETYIMQEQLVETGWTTDWGDDGVRKTKPFVATHPKHACAVHYNGAYQRPSEALQYAGVHVGITDCDFSGGLLEFATLEAIDCGCVPVITAPFVPHAKSQVHMGIIEREFKKFTPRRAREAPDSLYQHLASVAMIAQNRRCKELIEHNRERIARECDPKLHAKAFIDGAL